MTLCEDGDSEVLKNGKEKKRAVGVTLSLFFYDAPP